MPTPGVSVRIGYVPAHPSHHWGTAAVVGAVSDIAQQYHGEFYCVPPAQGLKGYEPLGVNDLSLPWGGTFDVDLNWIGPHDTHHKGKAVDFRYNGGPNGVIYIPEVRERFLQICHEKGLYYRIWHPPPGPPPEHMHCAVNYAGN